MNHNELLERWRETTQAIDAWNVVHKPRKGRPNRLQRVGCTALVRLAAQRMAELLTDIVEARERRSE
jgi:hypothetical protein